jgi:hypothetical protein
MVDPRQELLQAIYPPLQAPEVDECSLLGHGQSGEGLTDVHRFKGLKLPDGQLPSGLTQIGLPEALGLFCHG